DAMTAPGSDIDPAQTTGTAADVARFFAMHTIQGGGDPRFTQLLLRHFQYNAKHQQTASFHRADNQNQGYDARGHQTSAGLQTRTFEYADRLVSDQTPDGIAGYTCSTGGLKLTRTLGSVTTQYTYDAEGRM